MNRKIQIFLEKEYSKILQSNKVATYRISDCGPPWIGAMLSHMIHCSNVSYNLGYKMNISSKDFWEMIPDGKFSDVFDSLDEVDDSQFSINDFNFSETRISYNHRKQEGLDIHFSPEVAYFYPKGLETIVGIKDRKILSDIWKSFLLKKIYKLSTKYKNIVSTKVSKFKTLTDYAAIHIRRGDKVNGKFKESNYIPTENYFKILENSNFNFKNIFVSTDSPEALEECLSLYGEKYHIVYDDTEIRHDGYPLKIRENFLDIHNTAQEELTTALKNFHILKNSKVLVGTPASWFFRISMLLRSYDKIQDVLYAEDLSAIPGYPEYYFHC